MSVTALCVSLGITIGVVVAVTAKSSFPSWYATLQLGRCPLPCWIGITPGKTSPQEAMAILLKSYADSSRYQVFNSDEPTVVVDKLNGFSFDVYLWSTRVGTSSFVDEIYLEIDAHQTPTLPTNATLVRDIYGWIGLPVDVARVPEQTFDVMGTLYPAHSAVVFARNICPDFEMTNWSILLTAPNRFRGDATRSVPFSDVLNQRSCVIGHKDD